MILKIELINDLTLRFQILDTLLAQSWVKRMQDRRDHPLDDPRRFYGFESQHDAELRALQDINNCIDTINRYRSVINRSLQSVQDQDTLNYLHSIFEIYHGHLDQQQDNFFFYAPDEVKLALAKLNVAVHHCESVNRGNRPRFVCTWYGMPKIKKLDDDTILNFGKLKTNFGSVCLNYCEIGKTLEDLARDRDNYISDIAFKPFDYFSADFVVKFFDDCPEKPTPQMKEYYYQRQHFFNQRGYTEFDHPRLLPYRFPVAQLIEDTPRSRLLEELATRQHITKVYLE